MKIAKGETRPGPPLTTVLRELADKLNADDWMRCSTEDDNSVYYIVGMQAHITEQEGRADHMSLSIPRRAIVSTFGEYQVHAQVASPKSSSYYIRQATSRLANCGVIDLDLLDKFVKGDSLDLSFLRGHIGGPGTESFGALADLLQAMVLAKGMEPEATEAEKRSELSVAVQKVYLQELSRVYEKVVERAASLETLSFSDPQLSEASRCYLYGFFRGTVLLSASALETALRAAVGTSGLERVNAGREGFFSRLVDEAVSEGRLGKPRRVGEEPELAAYSRKIFKTRNAVAHGGYDPPSKTAEEILNIAREVVEFVRQQLS